MFYAGVGSRKPPEDILRRLAKYASILEGWGYTLRSGGAIGCDKAFERGVVDSSKKEIFRSNDAEPWAYDYVRKCLPKDRPPYDDPKGYVNWDPYIKGLLARNMMQVLGKDGDSPVDFLVCWAPLEDVLTSKVGGTGYAIRCAMLNRIPVYNVACPKRRKEFEAHLVNILTSFKN